MGHLYEWVFCSDFWIFLEAPLIFICNPLKATDENKIRNVASIILNKIK